MLLFSIPYWDACQTPAFHVENSVLSERQALPLGGRAEAGPEEGLGLGGGTRRMMKAGLEAPQPALCPCGPHHGHGVSPDVHPPGLGVGLHAWRGRGAG